ncbi:hypothetical protein HK405_000259, partial [Cladochytrium tenue]
GAGIAKRALDESRASLQASLEVVNAALKRNSQELEALGPPCLAARQSVTASKRLEDLVMSLTADRDGHAELLAQSEYRLQSAREHLAQVSAGHLEQEPIGFVPPLAKPPAESGLHSPSAGRVFPTATPEQESGLPFGQASQNTVHAYVPTPTPEPEGRGTQSLELGVESAPSDFPALASDSSAEAPTDRPSRTQRRTMARQLKKNIFISTRNWSGSYRSKTKSARRARDALAVLYKLGLAEPLGSGGRVEVNLQVLPPETKKNPATS